MGHLGFHFFGVCDGHGINGHLASQFVKEYMPRLFEKLVEKDPDYTPRNYPKFYDRMPAIINKIFIDTDREMAKLKFDTKLSGTTCVILVFDRNTIFCGNVGDSRAVLYSHCRSTN
jgi:serine/threonine protein phosphatase PrpC